jgi:hypothetical protein
LKSIDVKDYATGERGRSIELFRRKRQQVTARSTGQVLPVAPVVEPAPHNPQLQRMGAAKKPHFFSAVEKNSCGDLA